MNYSITSPSHSHRALKSLRNLDQKVIFWQQNISSLFEYEKIDYFISFTFSRNVNGQMTRSFKSEKIQLHKVIDMKNDTSKLKYKAIPHDSHCNSYSTNAPLWTKICFWITQSRSASAAVRTEFWKLCPSPWDNTHSSLHLQPCESPPLPSLDIPKGSHPCTGRIKIILLYLEEMLYPLRPRLLLLPSGSRTASGSRTVAAEQPERSRQCHRHLWLGPAGDPSTSSSLAILSQVA